MKLTLKILIFSASVIFPQYAGYHLNSHSISGELIKAAGVVHLADVIKLNPRWHSYSIDGYNSYISANNLSPYQRQNFTVLVDNQKVYLNHLGYSNIDLLPFSADQIDSVVFVNSPIVLNGEFSSNGLIHIILKKPVEGLSISAVQNIGNETGDPGPYAFTPYKTPNVDKLSYNAGLNLTTTGDGWWFSSDFKYRETYVTNKKIFMRIKNLSPNEKAQLLGASFRLSTNIFNGNHSFFFGYSQHDDFFFFRPYGNELPVQRIFKHIGIDGNFDINQEITVRYELTEGLNDFIERSNKINLNFDLKSYSLSGKLEGIFKRGHFKALVGISLLKHDGYRSGYNNDIKFRFMNLYSILNYRLNKNYYQTIGYYGVKNREKLVHKGFFNNSWQIDNQNSIAFDLSFSQSHFNENINYWVWTQSGADILFPDLLDYEFTLNKSAFSAFAIDLSYIFSYQKYKVVFGSNYRFFKDYYLETPIYTYNNNNETYSSLFALSENERLNTAGLYTEFSHALSRIFSYELIYNFIKTLNGTNNFKEKWKEFPGHKINFRININTSQNFGIWTNFRYQSSTQWLEYKYIEAQSYGKYKNKIDADFFIDLSFQKWLWERRIWLNLLFMNILGRQEYSHPLGAYSDFRMLLQINLYLNL